MDKKIIGMTPDKFGSFLKNLLKFTAPALAVLFFQLSEGVDWNKAVLVGLYALYALLSDYLKKLK